VRAVLWDAHTAKDWAHLADGAGAIVNLAGANLSGGGLLPKRWTEERKRVIRDSRVNAGRAVVEAISQASQKPGVVIQVSGVGYYGPRGDEKLAEDEPPGDDFLARLAADDWEPSTASVEEMGVRRAIIFRFSGGNLKWQKNLM
jgi:NAD dependent epimerase/dehydratase family enzyme